MRVLFDRCTMVMLAELRGYCGRAIQIPYGACREAACKKEKFYHSLTFCSINVLHVLQLHS